MRVAIAGYGVEGEANCHYWLQQGCEVTVFDEKSELERDVPDGVETVLGQGVFEDMNGYDLVIRTAGLNPDSIKTDGKIWSATNEFFDTCPAPIIGVTGTKGKGTTCSLIAEILKASGKTVHLVGNIGVPALEVLPTIKSSDIVVFELSSFQLWDIQKSPETAVILMIVEDHLEVHADMNEYVSAKANIGIHQSAEDLMIYHPTNKLSARAAQQSPARKIQYMTQDGANVVGRTIEVDGNIVCDIEEVGLVGPHNLENVCAALTTSWQYVQNVSAARSAIMDFRGLPHRLEFVREVDGVKYYDDSQATGPDACIAALDSFQDHVVLIFGGSDKGLDLMPVLTKLDANRNSVVLIGQSSDKYQKLLDARGFRQYRNLGLDVTMEQIVKTAKGLANGDGVVLLSPAHASFDMFKSYIDRGDQFKKVVKSL